MISKVQVQRHMKAKFSVQASSRRTSVLVWQFMGGPCPGVPSSLKGSDGGHNLRIMESNRNTNPPKFSTVPNLAHAAHNVPGSQTEIKQEAEFDDVCTHHTTPPCVVKKRGHELGTYRFMTIAGSSPMKHSNNNLSMLNRIVSSSRAHKTAANGACPVHKLRRN